MSRKERVQIALQKEICDILQNKLKDPRIGFVTITGVEMSDDLRYAKIFFSILGKDEDKKKTIKALDSALGFIRALVAQRIQLRFAPEIVFKLDESVEYSSHIQKLLDEIKELDGSKRKEEEK